MKELVKRKIDHYFLISLVIGIILRIISLLSIYRIPDVYLYFDGAIDLINFDYNSFRPPGFSIIIIPFIILTGNGPLSAKLASFSLSIILIVYSYFIFTKASLKLFEKNKTNEIKAKYIGLIVSILISLNIYFIFNSGKGLREELISVLIIMIFYYTIVKEDMNLKTNISLTLSVSFLTLTHLTVGIFISFGIILFNLVSKLKYFKIKFKSSIKTIIIFFSFLISFVFWGVFSVYKFGEFFYNFHIQNEWFKQWFDFDLSSVENLINIFKNAIIFGIPLEIIFLIILIGFVFMILFFYILFRNIKSKQIFYIFIVLGINFAYLSIFLASRGRFFIPRSPGTEPSPRLIIYFFPFIFYIGAYPLGNIIVESIINNINSKKINYLMIFYFITYSVHGLQFFLINNSLLQFFLISWSIIIFLINDLPLLIFLIKYRNSEYYLINI